MTKINSLLQLLESKQLSLAVAESLTGGNVQALITAESGISKWFQGGITAYSVDQKIKHLGVEPALAKKHLGVHVQTASEMAIGVSKMFGTNIGLATTGFIEPYPPAGVTQPNAYIAVACNNKIVSQGYMTFPSLPRPELQKTVAEIALTMLIQAIQMPENT